MFRNLLLKALQVAAWRPSDSRAIVATFGAPDALQAKKSSKRDRKKKHP